jgi:hypothetical protein
MPHKPYSAEKVVHELLDLFTEYGHPGIPSRRSQWVSEEKLAEYRSNIPRPSRRLYEIVEEDNALHPQP